MIMKLERAILIVFLVNYLLNNVVAAIASFFPAGDGTTQYTVQFFAFIVFAMILSGFSAWWYGAKDWKTGAIFGAIGFAVAVVTAIITAMCSVLIQTASLAYLWSVLPKFGMFFKNWQTLYLLGYWVVPTTAVGFWFGRKHSA